MGRLREHRRVHPRRISRARIHRGRRLRDAVREGLDLLGSGTIVETAARGERRPDPPQRRARPDRRTVAVPAGRAPQRGSNELRRRTRPPCSARSRRTNGRQTSATSARSGLVEIRDTLNRSIHMIRKLAVAALSGALAYFVVAALPFLSAVEAQDWSSLSTLGTGLAVGVARSRPPAPWSRT